VKGLQGIGEKVDKEVEGRRHLLIRMCGLAKWTTKIFRRIMGELTPIPMTKWKVREKLSEWCRADEDIFRQLDRMEKTCKQIFRQGMKRVEWEVNTGIITS
jgi:hypothetical protein